MLLMSYFIPFYFTKVVIIPNLSSYKVIPGL